MPTFSDCQISLAQTGHFSTALTDYLSETDKLQPFYRRFPRPENFIAQIKEKQAHFTTEDRERLTDALLRQYEGLEHTDTLNIEQLNDPNTFTLTTGHQLNIFSGPLYFHYKIMTVINAARELRSRYPKYNFVPVYWMASEDHDLEEIRSFRLFGKTWAWETEQTGAVGRFHTEGLTQLVHDIGEDLSPFAEAYHESKTLAEATRRFVHSLYGSEGLLVLDADEAELKQAFAPIIEDDLFTHTAEKKVRQTTRQLEELGYPDQVFPRPINFFYLHDGARERIERQENGSFQVLNTDLHFSEDELKSRLQENPERFSPNVVMRPLYQECILPNVSYTGGPAEVAYWFQLREVFRHYEIPFPILLPRNFVLYLNKTTLKKMDKAALEVTDLFKDTHQIKKEYLAEQSENEFSLDREKGQLAGVFEDIARKADHVDSSLVDWTKSQEAQIHKVLDRIEQRLRKAEEKKHETVIRQIEGIKDKLFPDGGLQERSENVLNFYINDRNFLRSVQQRLDPFDFRLHVLTEE